MDAITKFAESAPGAVLPALEKALTTEPPAASASPFSVVVDLDEGRRLGLSRVPVTDAAASAMEVLRSRASAAKVTPVSMKSLLDGTIDIVMHGVRSREEVVRVQALFSARGAVDFRVLVPDPSKGPVPGAARPIVYEGKVPYADRLAAEAKRSQEARAAKRPYEPEDPRYRAVARAGTAASGTADFALVEEPRTAADALDERMVLAVTSAREPRGRVVLSVRVRPESQDALRRFAAENAGLTMAVLLDDVLVAAVPVPRTTGETLELALWPEGSPTAERDAEALAVLLAGGRLPWPLKAIPLAPTYGTDPPPDNLIARALTLIGDKAVPTLEHVAKSAPRAWSRASAQWALDQLRARSDAPGR